MSNDRDALVKEISTRLVALRRRAGLTQQGVANGMGKSGNGRRGVGKLERGAVANTSLLTVVEYLRAVRAGFADLKDVLDPYTSLPIPEPARKLAEAAPLPRVQNRENGDSPSERSDARYSPRFPGKRELRSRTPEPEEDLAVLRLRRRAGYWALRRLFEFYLHSGLNQASIPPHVVYRRTTAGYARRVFNALYRTHRATKAARAQRLVRLRAAAEKHALDRAFAEYAEDLAELAYEEMCEHDEIDWMPPEAEARAVMALKPKHRLVTDIEMCLAEWSDANARYARAFQELYARAHDAALCLTAELQCDARTVFRYKLAAMNVSNIGANTAPGTTRRSRSIAEFNAKQWPPEVDREVVARMLAAALEVWDSSRATMPPAPGPRPV